LPDAQILHSFCTRFRDLEELLNKVAHGVASFPESMAVSKYGHVNVLVALLASTTIEFSAYHAYDF
jgi:hypothetical protein